MLSARNVLAMTLLIAFVSLITMLYGVSRPPDGEERGETSHSTRGDGFRAVFELLGALGVPVERQANPPVNLEQSLERPGASLVLLAPRVDLVATEPAYLHDVRAWVRRGGRVVVSPAALSLFAPPTMSEELLGPPRSVLAELGLEGVSVESPSTEQWTEEQWAEVLRGGSEDATDGWIDEFLPELPELRPSATVEASGQWADQWDETTTVSYPEDGAVLATDATGAAGGPEPTGTLVIRDGEFAGAVIAASYALGEGEIVVVAEPSLFSNRLLGHADNAVVAFRLLAAGDGPVVFDEFYHGLTIRDNPLWLFAQPGYGATSLAVIMLLGVAIWRSAVFLGPPVLVRQKTRRTVAEYIDALSRLVLKSRSGRPFVLQEVREGVLQEIRRELRLPPGREDPAALAALLARRDPQRAERLLESVRAADNLLALRRLNRTQAIRSIERLRSCL